MHCLPQVPVAEHLTNIAMLPAQTGVGASGGAGVQNSISRPVFVDAFAGCGGLSLGLLKAGWKGLFAIEKDSFAFDTLKTNLTGEEARYAFDWPEWLETKPWTIESLMEAHGEQLAGLRGQVGSGSKCDG